MAVGDANELVELARVTPDCVVRPEAGMPSLLQGVGLPPDLSRFYQVCGGLELFQSSDYSIAVASPDRLLPSNLAVLGETGLDDRSDLWFTIGITPDREYLSIDLDPARLGRCYDSFHEVHGLVGESAVIATSFTDLLSRLLANAGRHWYWLEADFRSLGDAYDELRKLVPVPGRAGTGSASGLVVVDIVDQGLRLADLATDAATISLFELLAGGATAVLATGSVSPSWSAVLCPRSR